MLGGYEDICSMFELGLTLEVGVEGGGVISLSRA